MKNKMNSTKPNRGSMVFLITYILIVILLSFLALRGATAFGYRFLTFKEAINAGLDFKGGTGFNVHVTATKTGDTTDANETPADKKDFDNAISIITKRLKSINANTSVMAIGNEDIRVEAAKNVRTDLCKFLSTVGFVEIKTVPEESTDTTTEPKPEAKVVLTGDDVKSCGGLVNQEAQSYSLHLTFKDKAKLKTITEENLNKKLAFTLDGEEFVQTTVSSVIEDGIWNVSEVSNLNTIELLSIMLNDGKLPVSTSIGSDFPVKASLGENIGNKAAIAMAIILLVLGILLFVLYKTSGILTLVSIISWGLIWLIVFINLGETLNLAVLFGMIASFIVVVISSLFVLSNIKKFSNEDRSLISSIDHTYSLISKQIIFSNAGIIFIGVITFLIGTAPFEGFALSIMLGSACTLVSIMIITRLLFKSSINSGIANENNTFIGSKGV